MTWETKNSGTDRAHDVLKLGHEMSIIISYPYGGKVTAPVVRLYQQSDVLLKEDYAADNQDDARQKAVRIAMKTLQSRNIEAAKRFSAVKKAVEQLYPEDLPETPPAPVQTRLFETINGIVRGKTLGDIMTLAPGIGDAGLRSCAVLVKDKNNNTEARYGGKSLREVLSKESDLRYSVVKSYSERSDTQVWYVEFH